MQTMLCYCGQWHHILYVLILNVFYSAIMSACGDEGDCLSTPEASEGAKKLDDKEINDLPRPGQVDFINGGPPCQVYACLLSLNLVFIFQ